MHSTSTYQTHRLNDTVQSTMSDGSQVSRAGELDERLQAPVPLTGPALPLPAALCQAITQQLMLM